MLALAAVPGQTLGRLGQQSTASADAWSAAGAAIRKLHEAPPPPWPGNTVDELAERLAKECELLISEGVLPPEVVEPNRRLAEQVLRPWQPAFIHGDLHLEHLFVDGDEVSGIIDWSEARQGDALFDLASLTLGNEEHLDDLIAGYGVDVDRELVSAWWSYRCLRAVRWLIDNGYGTAKELPEVAVLRSQV